SSVNECPRRLATANQIADLFGVIDCERAVGFSENGEFFAFAGNPEAESAVAHELLDGSLVGVEDARQSSGELFGTRNVAQRRLRKTERGTRDRRSDPLARSRIREHDDRQMIVRKILEDGIETAAAAGVAEDPMPMIGADSRAESIID